MVVPLPRVIFLSRAEDAGSREFLESIQASASRGRPQVVFEQHEYRATRAPSEETLFSHLCRGHVVVSLDRAWHERLLELRLRKKNLFNMAAIPPQWLDPTQYNPSNALKLIQQSHLNEQRERQKLREERERETQDRGEANRRPRDM